MFKTAIIEVIAPLVRRLGSMGAGAVLTLGATSEQAGQIEAGLVALGLVVVDLAVSHFNRKGK